MGTPTTWENIPMSQDDNTTIGEYIAAQIATHNADADAHMDDGASLASHREQETLDHPELSVQAAHIVDDVITVAPKAGVLPAIGTSWTLATTSPTFDATVGAYCAAGTGTYIGVAADGHVTVSADGDTWSNGDALPTGTYSLAAASPDIAVVGGSVSGGVALQYSVDGTAWTACSGFIGAIAYSLLWDGSKFVANCTMSSGHGRTNDVFTSTDGITWTAKTASIDVAIASLGYDGVSEYRGLEYSQGRFYVSSDLVTWNTVDVNARDFLYTLIWTGNQWVASGINDNDSTDPETITPIAYVAQIQALPSRSVAVLGDTWSAGYAIPQIAFLLGAANGYSMAITNPTTGLWSNASLPTGYGANGIFASTTRIIAVGTGTTVGPIYYSDIPT